MGFWSQVILGKSRKIALVEILSTGARIERYKEVDDEYLKNIISIHQNGTLVYGGEYAQIYNAQNEQILKILFYNYGEKKAKYYKTVSSNMLISLEVSRYGETAILTMLNKGNVLDVTLKLVLE